MWLSDELMVHFNLASCWEGARGGVVHCSEREFKSNTGGGATVWRLSLNPCTVQLAPPVSCASACLLHKICLPAKELETHMWESEEK